MTSIHADTVPGLFVNRVAATPDVEAYQYPLNGGWQKVSWREMFERVRDLASGLKALGLKPEQRGALLCSTRFEWILVDTAILCAGGATTTIYPSTTPDEMQFILSDSDSVVLVAETEEHVQKVLKFRNQLPSLKQIVTIDGKASADGFVITLQQLEEKGRAFHAAHPNDFDETVKAVRNDQLATLIYTSGTTGRPKGVELIHDCWVYEAEGIDALKILNANDLQYLWLPLAHVFGKTLQVAQFRIGFATAVDGRVDKLVENLGAVHPTFVAAVPRIFEKVYNRVIANAKEGGAAKAAIFKWAIGVGRQVSKLKQQGKSPGLALAAQNALAEKLVFSKLKALFGGRVRYFVSGSAPLSRELAEFFHAAGIMVLEGYGLTETSAAIFVNRPDQFRFGTVGPPLPGTEIKLAKEDNEILVRGRALMRGYRNLPEATAEALDSEGWLHTGDIGSYDDGFLKITDRKKDLIKTSGGKYVAPQSFEGKLKIRCPYVSQVLVHGNNRNFCVALISLDEEAIKKWAKENGLGNLSYAELAANEKVKALIQTSVNELNATLANYEQVKKFTLLPQDLTLESGDLTPSLKLKRKAVEQKYKAQLDAFYSGALADV